MEDKHIDSMIDAFIALRDVSDDAVANMIKPAATLSEGRSFAVHSYEDMSQAQDFFDNKVNVPATEIEVIDMDKNALDHIKDPTSYIGQAILCCDRCRSNTFIDMDKLVQSEDDPDIYNIGLECPHCHADDCGYTLIGQVGRAIGTEDAADDEEAVDLDITDDAEDDEFELEFPNEDKKADKAETFENDVEEEKSEEESPAEEEEEIKVDTFLDDEEEPDGMETSEAEEDDDVVEKEVTTRDGKKLKLKLTKKLGDVYEEDFEEDSDKDDVNEALADEIIKDHIQDNYGDEAWKLGQIMMYMNDEDAYFGSWLYTWPDGESYEECLDDFGDKDDYDDLRKTFERIYRRYHSGGLFEAPAEVEAAAHEIDKQLGLKPIENLSRPPKVTERVNEADNFSKVSKFMKFVVDPTSIKKIVINNPDNDSLFEGLAEDINPNYCNSKVKSFNVGNGFLTCNIDDACTDGNKLGSFLKRFDDENSDKIILWNMNTGDECFQGCKKDAIDQFGDCQFCGIEAPQALVIKIESDEKAPAVEKKPIDKYIEKVYTVNNLNPYAADNKATNEYWISETLRNAAVEKDDAQIIFKEFIEPSNNPMLIEGFKLISEGKELSEEDVKESDVSTEWVKLDYDELQRFGRNTKWGVADPNPKYSKHLFDLYSERGDFYGRVKNGVRELKLVDFDGNMIQGWDEFIQPIAEDAYHKLDMEELIAVVDEEWPMIKHDLGNNASVRDIESYLEENALKDIEFDSNLLQRVLRNKLAEVNTEQVEANVRSFKSRKDLSEAIMECKNNNRTYTVKRSVRDGFRYDLIVDEAVSEPDPRVNPDDYKSDDLEASADDYEELQQILNSEEYNEDLDDEEALVPVNHNSSALDTLSAVERATIQKIARVAGDISDAVADTYDLEIDPQLVAADILQDLRLISHDIDPESLPDTASNRATKEMFKSFEATLELVDGLLSMFTGETIESTPDRRLAQAIQMLDSQAFSTAAIRKGIASQAFQHALRSGAVPFIAADQVAQLPLGEEVEFPADKFDADLNEYFKANYDKNISYVTNSGKYDANKNIVLEGVMSYTDDDNQKFDLDVRFTLNPITENLDESISKLPLEEALAETTYRVTNNLSEEVFEFKA